MTQVSDRISISWPGAGANHTITFLTTAAIPPGGKIEIVPEDGEFFVFDGFDYSDVDLATAPTVDGPWTDRELGTSTTAVIDGVVAVASSSSGSVTISLNSSSGIANGTYVQIELGTQASYGDTGDRQIINSSNNGSHSMLIRTYDESDILLKKSNIKVAILEPVTISSAREQSRMFGTPIGWLNYGTTQTILSIYTNYRARCHFDTASGTPYATMSDTFQYASSTQYYIYHNATINGLVSGQSYDYYVRCIDMEGATDVVTNCLYEASTTPYTDINNDPVTSLNCIDYWIPFRINGQEGTEGGGNSGDTGGEGTNSGSSGGGSGGGGSGGGSGGGQGNDRGRQRSQYLPYPPLPGTPGVIFTGWGYSNQDIMVLQDGEEVGYTTANPKAEFGAFLEELTKGVYTFTLYTQDVDGRRSANYSTTFWIDDGTQTTLANIILPPTISADKSTLNFGDIVTAQGYTYPLGRIEVWAYPLLDGQIDESKLVKKEGVANDFGQWSILVDSDELSTGKYYLKARSKKEGLEESSWSQAMELSIGGTIEEPGVCAGADLNGDGRVNLTDFSILLYYWSTNDACADQNHDGTVNLIDFSIMMYNWTG